MNKFTKRGGFTLIELLLVIGIIAILAAIVIVAINPTKQLADARNAQRRSDVTTILNALYQYSIDHTGNFPNGTMTGTTSYQVCNTSKNPSATEICNAAGALANANFEVLVPTYLVAIPVDPRLVNPTSATATGASYTVAKDANGRITVSAPGAENSTTISVTR